MDGNTWSAYRIQYGEPRIPRLPRRKRPNFTTSQSAGLATRRSAADGRADHWKLASKVTQNLDAALKEMIAVEVKKIGQDDAFAEESGQAATSTERAFVVNLRRRDDIGFLAAC